MSRTFLVDQGAIFKSAWHFVLFFHSCSNFSKNSFVRWVFSMLFKKYNNIWGAVCLVLIPRMFLFLLFIFCYLLAFFAATSTSLLLFISVWIRTQWSSELFYFLRSVLIDPIINLNICGPNSLNRFFVKRIAFILLVKIIVWQIFCEADSVNIIGKDYSMTDFRMSNLRIDNFQSHCYPPQLPWVNTKTLI